MIIRVKNCRECPFCAEEYEQKICNLIPDHGKWEDDDGFDEMYQKGDHPKSCPLVREMITVNFEI